MTRPFLLLATQRTGSTVVWQTLDAHPRLRVRGEMFMKGMEHPESYPASLARWDRRLRARLAPGASVQRYLNGFFAERAGIDAAGFKLMYSQARPEIWDWLEARRGDVLHLVRANPLKILISKAAAEASGRRHLPPGERHAPRPVALPTEGLLESLDRIRAQVDTHRARLEGLRHLEITYEELLAAPQALFDRCFSFLGVEPRPVELALRKLMPDAVRDALTNYEEVAAILAGTPHAALLDQSADGSAPADQSPDGS